MRRLLLLACLAMGCNEPHPADTSSFDTIDTLSLFEPGLISDGFDNRDLALSPDEQELFYTLQYENRKSIIMHVVKNNNGWREPEIAWFSGTYKDLEATFSPDGNEIYFVSDRPVDSAADVADYNIWRITKTAEGWSAPQPLDSSINTKKDEFYPSVALSGNLYFTRDNDTNLEDIWMAVRNGNSYRSVMPLGDFINSKGYDFNAFVDPEEEFILFSSYKRADDMGNGDLYICRKKQGEWQAAIHLGNGINSSAIDYCPFVSPDGRFFFFTSARSGENPSVDSPRTKTALYRILNAGGGGSDDIYRMPAGELEKFY